jgi:hypothetical protein
MRKVCVLLVTTSAMLLAACQSGRGEPVSSAQAYFQDRLHLDSSSVVASRIGNECAVVSLRAPGGRSEGVAVVLQGRPIRWEAVGMSASLHLSDYQDNGDVHCGLANVGHTGTRGYTAIVGAFKTAGGPPGATPMRLDGRIDVHDGSPTGTIVANGAAHDGSFRVKIQPGHYWLVGRSPQVHVNGRQERCASPHPVEVRLGHRSRADVYCQIK